MTPDPSLVAQRFGYGLPLAADAPLTPAAMLLRLGGPDDMTTRFPIGRMSDELALLRAADQLRGPMLDHPTAASQALYDAALDAAEAPGLAATRISIARAVDNPDGFRERLVAFWADHFTTRAKARQYRFLPFDLIETAIRPNLTAPFADMLVAVTTHPAMLTYLDQNASYGPQSPRGKRAGKGLNENLARELLELHTLGVGAAYTQADVRQMAELLTGLAFDHRHGAFFDDKRVEPGAERVLGRAYDGTGLLPIKAALRDLAVRRETAAHLSSKLVRHFVSDVPDRDLVMAVQAAYQGSGGDLSRTCAALLLHPGAWQPSRQKARQPYDFIIASLRALGVTGTHILGMPDARFQRAIIGPMARMGQPYLQAPGPDGWPDLARDWITPPGLAARISWAMTMPTALVADLPDPVEFAHRALGSSASERLLWAVARAESRREGVGLVLVSPEFNQR